MERRCWRHSTQMPLQPPPTLRDAAVMGWALKLKSKKTAGTEERKPSSQTRGKELLVLLPMDPATLNGPVGNLSTVPEQGAEMEVDLLASCSARPPATAHGSLGLKPECGVCEAGRSKKFAVQKLLPTSSTWRYQKPTAWKVPLKEEGRGVFHADQWSGVGGVGCPAISWERPRGGRTSSHSPGLCISLYQLGFCVTVTQIAVGVSQSGGAVQRVLLII
jgi:hypothetical protein